ncbi:hypothetical protein [Streptomyces formicae]
MGLFNRKPPAEYVPANEEVAAAARALNRGNRKPADRLVRESGDQAQNTAMRVLADSVTFDESD